MIRKKIMALLQHHDTSQKVTLLSDIDKNASSHKTIKNRQPFHSFFTFFKKKTPEEDFPIQTAIILPAEYTKNMDLSTDIRHFIQTFPLIPERRTAHLSCTKNIKMLYWVYTYCHALSDHSLEGCSSKTGEILAKIPVHILLKITELIEKTKSNKLGSLSDNHYHDMVSAVKYSVEFYDLYTQNPSAGYHNMVLMLEHNRINALQQGMDNLWPSDTFYKQGTSKLANSE